MSEDVIDNFFKVQDDTPKPQEVSSEKPSSQKPEDSQSNNVPETGNENSKQPSEPVSQDDNSGKSLEDLYANFRQHSLGNASLYDRYKVLKELVDGCENHKEEELCKNNRETWNETLKEYEDELIHIIQEISDIRFWNRSIEKQIYKILNEMRNTSQERQALLKRFRRDNFLWRSSIFVILLLVSAVCFFSYQKWSQICEEWNKELDAIASLDSDFQKWEKQYDEKYPTIERLKEAEEWLKKLKKFQPRYCKKQFNINAETYKGAIRNILQKEKERLERESKEKGSEDKWDVMDRIKSAQKPIREIIEFLEDDHEDVFSIFTKGSKDSEEFRNLKESYKKSGETLESVKNRPAKGK
ncbi:MAG: hypothetical protein IJQ31_00235 [Thermoguttaceae bacterium]|nr:hypothetical protein [Thermoguttaceae bacterium]